MGKLEVACFNAESALRAAAADVHRIELCSERALGGITPPYVLLKDLRLQISDSIPIHVMIRPRGGHFTYTEAELGQMSSSIETLKPYCNGYVFGILKEDSTVDVEACSRLVRLANPLPCTFHRAFDETLEVLKALEDVASCGFTTILTSGRPGDAVDNIDVIQQLLHAAGRMASPITPATEIPRALRISSVGQVEIMAGGGLRNKDIATLQRSGSVAEWYHTSAIIGDGEIADEIELVACRIQAERAS